MILEQAHRLAGLTKRLFEAIMTAVICADAGETVHYTLRWVATTGEKGPPAFDGTPQTNPTVAQRRRLTPCQGWSETASATIGPWATRTIQKGHHCDESKRPAL